MSELLDAVDTKILDLVQNDAGLSVAEIAERVGLSSSPCWRRIKRLEDIGVIQRRVTLLDQEKLGLGFEVYATVKLSLPTRENLEAFEREYLTTVLRRCAGNITRAAKESGLHRKSIERLCKKYGLDAKDMKVR